MMNITQHHNHITRDGFYVDPAFTKATAAALARDFAFDSTISGNVYAQPLYLESGPSGRPTILVVTESNNVYALDAADGTALWQRNVGTPVALTNLPCGNIDPLGITGTPVVDLPSRALFFDAMTTPDGGTTKKHSIFSLNIDTGAVNSGWPVDVNAVVRFGETVFDSATQNQRGALAILDGILYVPYGGHYGDCGTYHGWLVGVLINNPASVEAWATGAPGGGSWAVGGVASDGTEPFIATGNTFGASSWAGGEAIIRFQPGPVFSYQFADYWAPANWPALDDTDTDLDGSGPLIVDAPRATPPNLVVALGKDGNAYLLNRTNLGGVSAPLAQAQVSTSEIIQAAATYRTAQGTFVVFCANALQLYSFRITQTSPPGIVIAWAVNQGGQGSPFVTSSDGTNDIVVWGIGAYGDQRLRGFEGNTGALIFDGGGSNELMSGAERYNTGIAVHGRIYIATDNKVYAFTVPVVPIVLTNLTTMPNGAFQFSFSNTPGLSFSAFATTNATAPFPYWISLGSVPEISPGQFQFTDVQATNSARRFYLVRTP
jgi:outer membrane protein assembly factor BamB